MYEKDKNESHAQSVLVQCMNIGDTDFLTFKAGSCIPTLSSWSLYIRTVQWVYAESWLLLKVYYQI